jgi:hypothetical protein
MDAGGVHPTGEVGRKLGGADQLRPGPIVGDGAGALDGGHVSVTSYLIVNSIRCLRDVYGGWAGVSGAHQERIIPAQDGAVRA